MAIHPLPQFEADLESDRKAYEALAAPTSLVIRFGKMRLIGEFPFLFCLPGSPWLPRDRFRLLTGRLWQSSLLPAQGQAKSRA